MRSVPEPTSTETSPRTPGSGGDARPGTRSGRALVGVELRISFALTLLTLLLLGLAGAGGLWPDPNRAILQSRSTLLEMIAISASQAAARGDSTAIVRMVQRIQSSDSQLRSVAVKSRESGSVYESADHVRCWAGVAQTGSTLTHAKVPVFNGAERWGEIEITFDSAATSTVLGVTLGVQTRALLLISLGAILVYWAAAHLVIRKLRTPRAFPAQAQRVFDAMTDAVVLLDDDAKIVTANRTFWSLTQEMPEALLGKSPDTLQWACERSTNLDCLPWRATLQDGVTRTRHRVLLNCAAGAPRMLSASSSAILGLTGRPMGVLVILDDVSEMEAQLKENASLLAEVACASEDLRRKNEELQILATTDPLTGCCNRRALFEQFNRFWMLTSRNNDPLGCIMIDIDHFKMVNDKHGHATGDKVLAEVGLRLRELVRASDVVGRYGGEEFCVIGPETDLRQTEMLAERIRRAIEAAPCGGLNVTVSLGIAARDATTPGFEALIARADSGLYAAKRAGRNRVMIGSASDISKAA